jgi:hypothetical protein
VAQVDKYRHDACTEMEATSDGEVACFEHDLNFYHDKASFMQNASTSLRGMIQARCPSLWADNLPI